MNGGIGAAIATALGTWVGADPAAAADPARWPSAIAHGMGNIQDIMVTNSQEAWEHNYRNGCRTFEADFWMASDGKLVAFHDHLEERLNLRKGFTHQEFMSSKLAGRFTPLDVDGVARLMVARRDWLLVSDVKTELKPALEQLCEGLAGHGIDCRERVIPQIYNLRDHIRVTDEMGWKTVILTLYRIDDGPEKILDFVRKHPTIRAVTLPIVRAKKEFFDELKQLGIPSYVHTIDSPKEIQGYLDLGASGVYTNYQCKGPRRSDPARPPRTARRGAGKPLSE
jgi:glycerophosphoryl diester phosphodiesterase